MSIKVENVSKQIGSPPTQILSNISFEIGDGEFVALTGKSGSGKSTLLYLISSLDSVSEGRIFYSGQALDSMEPDELYRFRNQNMGFVFQFHYLINELSALENVLMPGWKFNEKEKRRALAESLLEQFGLKDKLKRLPSQLSGGEQQRVAIARALVMEPKYLFADEPTGSLDTVNGDIVMRIITEANTKRNTTVVLVTHDPDFAGEAKRQIHLLDGKVVQE